LNGGIVEAAGFGQLAIHRDNLCGGRIEPEFEVLLDYNLVSHCGSRLYRDAALVRLITVLQRFDKLFPLYYMPCANEKSLERGSARKLDDARIPLSVISRQSPFAKSMDFLKRFFKWPRVITKDSEEHGLHQLPATFQSPTLRQPIDKGKWQTCSGCGRQIPV